MKLNLEKSSCYGGRHINKDIIYKQKDFLIKKENNKADWFIEKIN